MIDTCRLARLPVVVALAVALVTAACAGSDGDASSAGAASSADTAVAAEASTDAADVDSDVAASDGADTDGAVDAGEAADVDAVEESEAAQPAPDPSADTSISENESAEADEPVGTEPVESEPAESDESADAEPTPQPTMQTTVDLVSYDNDFATSIQPVIAEKCANCHAEGGPGASHWQITSAQDLVDTHVLIRGVVESNYMPPWPASDASIAFKDNRDLRPDQVQAIIDWSEAGAPLDVAPDTPVVSSNPVVGLVGADLVLTPDEAYAGDPNTVDDYRCQVYDPELAEGGWITGYEFVPDQTTVVHHAIGYVIEPERRGLAIDQDGADGRPGWECYGSSGLGSGGLGSDALFLGWAPGQDASLMPEGAGLWLPPDAFLVVQVHYHYEGDAPADLSALAVNIEHEGEPEALDEIEVATLVAPVEIPCAEWETGPLCDRDAALADAIERFGSEGVPADRFTRVCGASPADFADDTDGVVESSCTIPTLFVGAVGEVVSVLGHMHEIGDWFRMTLNPGTDDEVVLLDIPNWDFDWQYNYVPEEPIYLEFDDVVQIECGWDRARRDPSLEPAYILWADGTNDEMCFATITVRK